VDSTQQAIRNEVLLLFFVFVALLSYFSFVATHNFDGFILALVMTGAGFLYAYHAATGQPHKKNRANFLQVGVKTILGASVVLIIAVLVSLLTTIKLYALSVSFTLVVAIAVTLYARKPRTHLNPSNELLLRKQIFIATSLFVVAPTLLDFYYNQLAFAQSLYLIVIVAYGLITIATVAMSLSMGASKT